MKGKRYLVLSIIMFFIGSLSLFSTKSIVIAGLFFLGSLIIGITNILDKK